MAENTYIKNGHKKAYSLLLDGTNCADIIFQIPMKDWFGSPNDQDGTMKKKGETMERIVSWQHQKALDLMFEARRTLYQQLHTPGGICKAIIEGIDRLNTSFEFAENPDQYVNVCPDCESMFWEEVEDGKFRCLSCDEEWTLERHKEGKPS